MMMNFRLPKESTKVDGEEQESRNMKKAIKVTIEMVLIMYVMMWALCIETANAEMWIVAFGCLLGLLAFGFQENRMTQNEQVLDYMQKYGSITALDAMRDLGCMRLASRISDLKKNGHRIITTKKSVVRRDGTKAYIAEYGLGAADGT
jgi:hypothetical protein